MEAEDVTADAHKGVHQHHGTAFLRQNGRELGVADYGAPGSFDDAEDRQTFFRLLQDADVFTCSYLNLGQKGISPKALAASKPGFGRSTQPLGSASLTKALTQLATCRGRQDIDSRSRSS